MSGTSAGFKWTEANRIDIGWGGSYGGNMECYSKDHSSRAGNYHFVFGDGTTADGSSGTMKIYHKASGHTEIYRFTDQGNFHADADVTAYSSTVGSDRKLKTNIVDTKYGLKDVLNLRGVDFNWKEKREGVRDVGFIAQEVQEIVPE